MSFSFYCQPRTVLLLQRISSMNTGIATSLRESRLAVAVAVLCADHVRSGQGFPSAAAEYGFLRVEGKSMADPELVLAALHVRSRA